MRIRQLQDRARPAGTGARWLLAASAAVALTPLVSAPAAAKPILKVTGWGLSEDPATMVKPGGTIADCGAQRLYTYARFSGFRNGAPVRAVWRRDGALFSRLALRWNLGSRGKVWFMSAAATGGGAEQPLQPGRYSFTCSYRGKVVARSKVAYAPGPECGG